LLAQARRARQDLLDVLDLLPGVRVVVLLGKQTERAWRVVDPGGYDVVTAPHPSPLAWHQMSVSGVRNSALTINAFSRAAATIAA
jgi:uracil DNA glycosylase